MNLFSHKYFQIACAASCGALLAACASIGNPSGGPRDEDPPRFLSASPQQGATNVSQKRVRINFNEIVNVKDAFTNVIISPPTAKIPKVTSQGSSVLVDFSESLLPNTTYTIDFGNAIEDNNEGNKLNNFAYTFATGESIDSLRISGIVLGAENLEPRPGLLVGIYDNLNDSAFFSNMPLRIARTDDRGRFIIRGVAPGQYRIYALNDVDADRRYANPEEEVAFLSDIIVPSVASTTVTDSIHNRITGKVDSTYQRIRSLFLPNNLLLRTFTSDARKQYIKDYQRLDSTRLQLVFNSRQSSLPSFSLLNDNLTLRYAPEHSQFNDTVTLWLRGSNLLTTDTLRVAVEYLLNDASNPLLSKTDTLQFITRKSKTPVLNNSAKGKNRLQKNNPSAETEKKLPALAITMLSQAGHDVNRPLLLEFETPLVSLNNNAFHLLHKPDGDSLYIPIDFTFTPLPADSGSLRKFALNYDWDFNTNYRLVIDSLAATGIYGLSSNPLSFDFKTKNRDDYCSLTFNITGWPDDTPAFMQLLNASDNPVAYAPVINNQARFNFLPPGKYYARIYEDFNGNGRYDAGDVAKHIFADNAYYFPKLITLKKNWDQVESWNPFELAVDLQKPNAVKKNKPASDKLKKVTDNVDEEDADQPFDPNANPFDPNDSKRRKKNQRLR